VRVARSTGRYAAPKRTWYISSVDLFENVADAEVQAWAERCETRTFEPGQRIVDADTTPPEQVLVVCEGAVRLLLEGATGRSETVDVLGRGHLFGVSAAFGRSSRRLHADALTRVVVCASEGRIFLVALASCPDMVLNLVRQAGMRLMHFEVSSPQPRQLPADVRLVQVLRRLALTAGEPVRGGGWRIPRCVTRGTLAHQVGCTRETIARMLSNLAARGAVTRQGHALVVHPRRLDTMLASRGGVAVVQQPVHERARLLSRTLDDVVRERRGKTAKQDHRRE
jgi:CRP/FNR family transcriptional regulator